MTNGEKLQKIFPNVEYEILSRTVLTNIDNGAWYSLDWWNAEYKESTIRNCVGCKYSKKNHNAGTEKCHLCMWENQYTPTTKNIVDTDKITGSTTKNDLGVDAISRAEAQAEIEIKCKYQQLEDFAKWVAVEVIDEELWTYNHLSFAEIACRKLVKLGIMQESDGEYTYEVVEDGNDKRREI